MPDDGQAILDAPRTARAPRTRRRSAWLCCRACGRRIAPAGAAMSFDGAHRHRFLNPHGFDFEIGLYAEAPGCIHEGPATEYFSWFPGFEWRIALCAGCRAHLGWAFGCVGPPGAGEPDAFHGLIVERLQPGPEGRGT